MMRVIPKLCRCTVIIKTSQSGKGGIFGVYSKCDTELLLCINSVWLLGFSSRLVALSVWKVTRMVFGQRLHGAYELRVGLVLFLIMLLKKTFAHLHAELIWDGMHNKYAIPHNIQSKVLLIIWLRLQIIRQLRKMNNLACSWLNVYLVT